MFQRRKVVRNIAAKRRARKLLNKLHRLKKASSSTFARNRMVQKLTSGEMSAICECAKNFSNHATPNQRMKGLHLAKVLANKNISHPQKKRIIMNQPQTGGFASILAAALPAVTGLLGSLFR